MVQFNLVLALLLALLVAVFAVQNSQPVDIHFLKWRFTEISLVLVIIGSVFLGAALAFFLGLVKQISLVRHIKEVERDNRRLAEELAGLKEQQQVEKILETESGGDTVS